MEPESFLWELQVLTNQFLRKSIDSPLQLRPFCRQLRQQMQNPTFADEIRQTINTTISLFIDFIKALVIYFFKLPFIF